MQKYEISALGIFKEGLLKTFHKKSAVLQSNRAKQNAALAWSCLKKRIIRLFLRPEQVDQVLEKLSCAILKYRAWKFYYNGFSW